MFRFIRFAAGFAIAAIVLSLPLLLLMHKSKSLPGSAGAAH